jgi:Fungal Zn(2)-Cys(6) binuclear cluster domain
MEDIHGDLSNSHTTAAAAVEMNAADVGSGGDESGGANHGNDNIDIMVETETAASNAAAAAAAAFTTTTTAASNSNNPQQQQQLLCASCDYCRSRKTKCDGKRPCANCLFKYMKKNKVSRYAILKQTSTVLRQWAMTTLCGTLQQRTVQ